MEILFFLVAFLSEIIGTIVGFGSSTIFLPFALILVDFKTALVLVAIFHIFGNLSRVSFFRYSLDKKILIQFGIISVFLTIIGALFIPYIPQDLLKGILGIFLITYSILLIWKENFKVLPTLSNTLIGGGLSGLFAGLIGTGGALRGIFLAGFGLSKEKYLASSAAIALAVDFTRVPIYLSQGFLTRSFYWYILVLLPIAFIGSYFGKKVVDKIPQNKFKKVVLIVILIIGIKFIFDYFI